MVIIKVIIIPFIVTGETFLIYSFQNAFTMNLVLITFVYGGFQYLVSARPSISEETIQGKYINHRIHKGYSVPSKRWINSSIVGTQ